jgi:hypothetical protein
MVDEQTIDRLPMERVRRPKTPTNLVPVMRERHRQGAVRLQGAAEGAQYTQARLGIGERV